MSLSSAIAKEIHEIYITRPENEAFHEVEALLKKHLYLLMVESYNECHAELVRSMKIVLNELKKKIESANIQC